MRSIIICHIFIVFFLISPLTAQKYIFTGPPGSGKTTLILALEMYAGFEVIREAAADIIYVELSQKIAKPWQDPTFDGKIFELQRKRLQHTTNNSILCDRSPIDIYAYAEFNNNPIPTGLNEYVTQMVTDPTMSKTVFFIESLGSVKQTEIRSENIDQALTIEKLLYKYYTFFGFNVVRIPALPLEKRLAFILALLNEK